MADTAATATHETAGETQDGIRRRDFLDIAAVSAAGIGGLAVVYPLVSQMAPSKDVLAASTTEVDVSAVEPGQAGGYRLDGRGGLVRPRQQHAAAYLG